MFTNKTPFNYGNPVIRYLCTSMKKLIVIAAGIFVAGCAGNSPGAAPVVFDFDPPSDTLFMYRITTNTFTQANGGEDTAVEELSFLVRNLGRRDSLHVLDFRFIDLRVIQPATEIKELPGKGFMMQRAGDRRNDTISAGETASWSKERHLPVHIETKFRLLRAAMGAQSQVLISNSGEIKEVSGYDTIVSLLRHSEHEDRHAIHAALNEVIGTRAVSDLLTQVFFYLPGRELKAEDKDKGADTWIKNYVLTAKAPVKYSHFITLYDSRNDSLHLKAEAEISAKAGEGGPVYATGNQMSTVIASLRTGMIYSGRFKEKTITNTDEKYIMRRRESTIELLNVQAAGH
jgi:hypothetical protein